MTIPCLLSDQLLMWSALYAGYFLGTTQTSPAVTQTTAGSRDSVTRFIDRTLQALRQARLQMRQRSGPWTQVLLVRELPRHATPDGLCSASRLPGGCRALKQFPPGARNHRENLRDQSRVVAAPRGALRPSGEPPFAIAHGSHRFTARRRTAGQYARCLARQRVPAATFRGDRR